MTTPTESPPRPTRARVTLAVWLASAASIAYLCRNCIGVAEKTIREDLGLSEQQMGHVMALFFWSYALAQIPGGRLGEKFGSRKVLPALSSLGSIAMILWSTAGSILALMAGRIAIGLAQAGLFPCSTNTIARWFPGTERAFASGTLGAAMNLGAILAAPLTGWLLDLISWRTVFVLYAMPGFLWALGFHRWFRDAPADHASVNDAELTLIVGSTDHGQTPSAHAPVDDEAIPWKDLLTSPKLLMICGQQFFRAAAAVWFASWFATYLQETRGVTRAASGVLTAIPLAASMIAPLCAGGLSDYVLRRTGNRGLARKGVAAVALLACSVLVFSAWFIEDATLASLVIGAGAFFAACAGPCAYSITMDMGGRHVATVFSTMNMIGNFGAAIFAQIVPTYRQWVLSHDSLMALCGGNSWNAVLLLFGTTYVLAAACWLMLDTTGNVITRDTSEPGDSHD